MWVAAVWRSVGTAVTSGETLDDDMARDGVGVDAEIFSTVVPESEDTTERIPVD